MSQEEWKELYGKTPKSVWKKRIGEKVKLVLEDRKRRMEKKKENNGVGGKEIKKIRKAVSIDKANKRRKIEEGGGETSSDVGKKRKKIDKGKGKAVDQDQGGVTATEAVEPKG